MARSGLGSESDELGLALGEIPPAFMKCESDGFVSLVADGEEVSVKILKDKGTSQGHRDISVSDCGGSFEHDRGLSC